MKKNILLLVFCLPIISFTSSCGNDTKISGTGKATASSGSALKTSKSAANSLITKVRSVSVSPLALEMPIGEQTTITGKVYMTEGGTESTVVWQSSDPNVATIDSTGHIKSYKEGKITITAISKVEPDKSASMTVVVSKQAVMAGSNLSLGLRGPNPQSTPVVNSTAQQSTGTSYNSRPKSSANTNDLLLGIPNTDKTAEPKS